MGLRPGNLVVALAALAALASACTSSEPGTPTPGAGGSSAPTAPPPTDSSQPSLPTPSTSIVHPVDLKNVKPCSLFSSGVSVAAHTSGDGGQLLPVDVDTLPGAKGCFQTSAKDNVGLTVAVAPSTDLNSYSTSQAAQAQQFTVHGYPAVIIPPMGVPACFGGIGVADHQMIYLRYGLASPTGSPQVPQAELCSRLRPVAEQVVAQLAQ